MKKAERDKLLKELEDIDDRLYPKKGNGPRGKEYRRLHGLYYEKLEEYFERLPRVVMSVCPYCGKALKRSIDPFGLDGHWWAQERLVNVREPEACPHFKVMLGALKVRPGDPVEATHNVQPGPDVPFVVPRLLELPGMIAVVGRIELETGDVAFPIAYFSDKKIRAVDLHATWLRSEYWFKDESGNSCWNISNDEWSFELKKFLEDKRLHWTDMKTVMTAEDEQWPYEDLEGVRRPQIIYDGEVDYLEPPTGEIVCPFE
jgi:hypothetical protein